MMRSTIQEHEAVQAAAARFVQSVAKAYNQNSDIIHTEKTLA